jgi:hypothetical protein
MKRLEKYSMGVGDRFGREGDAQLAAFRQLAEQEGVVVTPVWNKSNREHAIIGTKPEDVRREANAAVRAADWRGTYHVDADHISMKNVDGFVSSSDFFTLDVADHLGETTDEGEIYGFVSRHEALVAAHEIKGLPEPVVLTRPLFAETVRSTLFAVRQAGRIYRHIVEKKDSTDFVTEISMDETLQPQSPVTLLVVLAEAAEENIPLQTIAPKFSGRFNKGVDYVGDAEAFAKEFYTDACVVRYAARRFALPDTLKLSIHSGSDKFSLYPHVAKTLKELDIGVHVKTAGTTWLEELVGLALSGGEGLAVAKEIYARARPRVDELCAPYATVIDVDPERLPTVEDVGTWDGARFAAALRNAPGDSHFNPCFRQFLHVAYKVAAELGPRYLAALDANRRIVARHVTENLYARHLQPIFGSLDTRRDWRFQN